MVTQKEEKIINKVAVNIYVDSSVSILTLDVDHTDYNHKNMKLKIHSLCHMMT